MPLRVEVQHAQDVTVLRCSGRILRGDPVCVLKDTVIAQRNARIVILDLSDVEILDGGGLGMLVFLQRWTKENGIQLKLVNPSDLVREMLDRTHLTEVFDISSVGDALEILGCQHYRTSRQEGYSLAAG
jgi:anti-anti-sigma factor